MTHHPASDDPEAFEEHLRAQPPARLPAHWRADILTAALNPPTPSVPRWNRAAGLFAAWLWPHPLAYAVLLAGWGLS